MIGNNLEHVKNQINDVCNSTQREVQGITLIAVSKTKPVSMLEEAYQNGCRDFGENKVQELVDKYERLPKDIRWHMIGHLQSNKLNQLLYLSFNLSKLYSNNKIPLSKSKSYLVTSSITSSITSIL